MISEHISNEELTAIKEYLTKARKDELGLQFQYATYSEQELQLVFPAIRKLTRWGWSYNQRLPKSEQQSQYNFLRPDAPVTDRHTFMLVITDHKFLKTLLDQYLLSKDRLFTMKIADMTPIEQEAFRKFIGG
ncbi:hypothetical protein [Spirosoma flavum]|uniref:Uncharacterized protein n=1 Tax=Spirosoma flavum TaxID=2048557 RepID=A0ABW6AQU3_9BACT